MKYKVGDRVRVQSLDWYNENKNKSGNVPMGQFSFNSCNKHLCGTILTIKRVLGDYYLVKENDAYWTDEMIEGLAEEDNVNSKWTGLKVELELSKSVIGVSNVVDLYGERFMSGFVKAIIPPEGYIFKDENGNVINATKIVLEKKKKEYPKTYTECLDILSIYTDPDISGYKGEFLWAFHKLLICRDAYWKIAGEEMGLGNPWNPDWKNRNQTKYCIYNDSGDIKKGSWFFTNAVFAFPTSEMRDAFYKNFKSEIEICKELL